MNLRNIRSRDHDRREPRTAGPTTSPSQHAEARVDAHSAHDVSSDTPVPSFECPNCQRTFTTKIGLGVHRRHAHPEEVNREVIVDRVKRHWSDEELRLMAREEASAVKLNIRFINQHLVGIVPGRTLEAIKGARKGLRYRELVLDFLRQDEDSSSSSSESFTSATSDTNHLLDINTPLSYQPRRSPSDGHSAGQNNQDYLSECRAVIEDLIPSVSSIRGWNSAGLIQIAYKLQNGDDVFEAVDEWITGVFPTPQPTQRRHPQIRFVNPSRKLKRRLEYSQTQFLFRRNMSRAARCILDGETNNVASPDAESMARHWGPFVSQASSPVPLVAPAETRQDLAILWSSISCNEIRSCSLPISSAPGVDGITPRLWRAVPCKIKALLFNIILVAGGFPGSMLASRTVFIPKKGDCRAPENYRPISIMSVVVRHLHKILAHRLRSAGITDLRQRCFDDGCSDNVAVLATTIMEARTKFKELHVASLDVAKAYDSVSHGAIQAALCRAGVPEGFRSYIDRLYKNSCTTFEVRGERSTFYRLGRGVRQGDPLSSILFSLVIDAVINVVPAAVGFPIGNEHVNTLAYADDILLFAATEWGMQTSLGLVEKKAREQGLLLHPDKCSVLSIVPAGKHKKVKIIDTPTFTMEDGTFLPQLKTTAEWRYLGVDFQASGLKKTKKDLGNLLENVTRAPLKPQQRLKILRSFLLPRIYHGLILGRTTLRILRTLDIQVRAAVRKWLRLPGDVAVGFFHASIRDGGLGIPPLITSIPGLMYQRLQRLETSTSPAVRAAYAHAWTIRRLRWAERVLSPNGVPLASAYLRRKWWAERLHRSVDGKELEECKSARESSWWVDGGSLGIPGRDYVQYVHVRINCLPTLVRTTRGVRRTTHPTLCRAGCSVMETAAHIIQQCHRTHGGRVRRHNAVCRTLAGGLRTSGWSIEEEPVFLTRCGKRKPDLVCSRGGEVCVVDAQVVSGATSLEAAHMRKRDYYATNPDITATLMARPGTTSVRYTTCTLSWRGIWASKSVSELLRMGLSSGLLKGITTRTLQGSHTNWSRWNKTTTIIDMGPSSVRQGVG
ncbi:hypothetical protein KM043_018807 [Ampulex compressa]|nr:hypothetical protein KM043_018807 [Ampulex compressa]